jgi:hypothetical protein
MELAFDGSTVKVCISIDLITAMKIGSGLASLADQATGRSTHHFAQLVEVLLDHGGGVQGSDVRAFWLRRVVEACGGGGLGTGEEE